MRIEKKSECWPELFQKVFDGEKNFDVRLVDFVCRPADALVLHEWNPKTKNYTGRVLENKVTFLLKTKDLNFLSEEEIRKYGLQVISF